MLIRFFKKIVRFAWLVPGFLLWAAFPPMGERFDCFFALAPLLWLARYQPGDSRPWEKTERLIPKCTRTWFFNGFIFWFATLAWMPAIVKNNGPWPLVLLGWGALAAYCALYFAAFGFLSSRYWRWAAGSLVRRFLGLLAVEPLLWCGLELVRSRFLGGFAWNQLGVAPINAGFGAPAALGGVYLVSAVVVLVNGTIASIAERFLERRASPWRSLETFVPFGLVFAIYSLASTIESTNRRIDESTNPPLSVALVQRNFPCCFKPQEAENPCVAYSNLCSHLSYLKPDLVVLSESALAEIGAIGRGRDAAFAQWLMQICDAQALLAGGGRMTDGRAYNSAALYLRGDSAAPAAVYDKVHLVPFGEFIPGDKLFPVLQKLAPVGSCTPGELKTLELNRIPLGVAICYEDTDSAQIRELARQGAQVLVFITNDSWFSYSDETVSHAWQATARAIETGLPVVRVGNSGVTGVIYPDGRASWLCAADGWPLTDDRGVMFERVPVGPAAPEPYCILGDWPLGLAFALLLTVYLSAGFRRYREQRRIRSMAAKTIVDRPERTGGQIQRSMA